MYGRVFSAHSSLSAILHIVLIRIFGILILVLHIVPAVLVLVFAIVQVIVLIVLCLILDVVLFCHFVTPSSFYKKIICAMCGLIRP